MSDDLKPCPFCGGKPKWISGGPGCAYISCTECPAETGDGSAPRIKEAWNKRADRTEELEAKLRQAFGDMEQIYRRWKNGVRYDVLAKEQGVTRERMRHRLLRYEDDKVRQLEAEIKEARMQALSELGQAQEAYEAQKKAEAERDAAIAALTKIERTYYMEATNPSPETIRKMAARMNGIARDAQDAIRAQIQERDE